MPTQQAVAIPVIDVPHIQTDDLASITQAVRDFDHIRRNDRMINVVFEKLRVRKGYNLRKDFGDIEELADSIEAVGQKVPFIVDVLKDGTPLIVSGERRYRAIQLLRNRSKDLKARFQSVPCIIADRNMKEEDRIVHELASNSGKPLEALEEAEGFKRLTGTDFNLNPASIARLTGHSVAYVEQRLLLANESDEVKEALKNKTISSTAVVTLNRKMKDPEARKKLVKEAADTGQKVSVKQAAKKQADPTECLIGKDTLQELINIAKHPEEGDWAWRIAVIDKAEKILNN